jgi:integrase
MRALRQGSKRADGRWVVRLILTDPSGKKVAKAFYGATQREAQAKAAEFEKGKGRNLGPNLTIGDLIDAYEEIHVPTLGDGTLRQYRPALKKIRARFGNVNIGDLDRRMIAAWLNDLKNQYEGAKGRTIQVSRNVLGFLYRFAQSQGLVDENPAHGLPLPSGTSLKARKRPKMTPGTYSQILDAEEDPVLRSFYYLLGEAGLRPNEALRLTRDDLEYHADMWWVRVHRSKTEAGTNRAVPIPDDLASVLYERKGFLFAGPSGKALRLEHIRFRKWNPLVERLGLAGLQIKDLRPMCLTRWTLALEPEIVRHFAGHADFKTTSKHYVKMDRDHAIRSLWSAGVSTGVSKKSGHAFGIEGFEPK